MIRLFASDMDGTLLNDKGYISDRTINAVKKLQKHGIHFIVNTGRDYRAAKRELDAASLSCDMICTVGLALIMCTAMDFILLRFRKVLQNRS